METPFRLVPDRISHDTVAAKTIVEQAEEGGLIGLAYTGMYRQGHNIVNTTGESHKSPTFTIGTVVVLLYKLIKMIISRQGGMPK
jgi:hypothetical protein